MPSYYLLDKIIYFDNNQRWNMYMSKYSFTNKYIISKYHDDFMFDIVIIKFNHL